MADWALGASNVKADPKPDYEDNGYVEENDLMIVPFPKQPGSDEYYLNCNFGAKMLVKNSDKGAAVAAYIKCERLASMIDEYKDAAKEKAIIPEVNAQGKLKSYVTEEQYDALQDYKDPKNITPVFDFGYGMGSKDFPMANCVRAMLGQTEDAPGDQVVELQCNLDDMTPEDIGFAVETLLENGALEDDIHWELLATQSGEGNLVMRSDETRAPYFYYCLYYDAETGHVDDFDPRLMSALKESNVQDPELAQTAQVTFAAYFRGHYDELEPLGIFRYGARWTIRLTDGDLFLDAETLTGSYPGLAQSMTQVLHAADEQANKWIAQMPSSH